MTGWSLGILGALALVGGCSVEAPREPSAPLRSLGITEIAIVESDTRLAIEGRDDQRRVLATLELAVGAFVMEEDDRGQVSGRQLSVAVLADTAHHESEGHAPLHLPYPRARSTGTFLSDPAVAVTLERWGLTLDAATEEGGPALPGDEAPYEYQCNGGGTLMTTTSGYTGCQPSTYGGCTAEWKSTFNRGPVGQKGEWRCCSATDRLADRQCTTPYGSTSCGTAGSLGCAVCWLQTLDPSDTYCRVGSVTSGGQCYYKKCDYL